MRVIGMMANTISFDLLHGQRFAKWMINHLTRKNIIYENIMDDVMIQNIRIEMIDEIDEMSIAVRDIIDKIKSGLIACEENSIMLPKTDDPIPVPIPILITIIIIIVNIRIAIVK
jgi:hypothetical protein